MEIKIKKTRPDAVVPQYATPGAACFDLHALLFDTTFTDAVEVVRGSPQVFKTGLAFEIPKDHVMLVFSRSGHGFKYNTRLANCIGVIDADYRGEVMVKLTCDTGGMVVKHLDRIAQAMVIPVDSCTFVEVDELSDTERGDGGMGSTGS